MCCTYIQIKYIKKTNKIYNGSGTRRQAKVKAMSLVILELATVFLTVNPHWGLGWSTQFVCLKPLVRSLPPHKIGLCMPIIPAHWQGWKWEVSSLHNEFKASRATCYSVFKTNYKGLTVLTAQC